MTSRLLRKVSSILKGKHYNQKFLKLNRGSMTVLYMILVHVTCLVLNLQTKAKHEKDGKPLRLRKGMIKDKTGSIEIVIFSSLVDEVSNR